MHAQTFRLAGYSRCRNAINALWAAALKELPCGSPLIFHDGLCSDISAIHATDDFMCPEVDCEALVEGSAAHYFQHVKGALSVSNTRAPFYRAIEKYFEEIIIGIHRPSCQSADRADSKIVRTAETRLFNFEHIEVWARF
jgi:hypothetical protein